MRMRAETAEKLDGPVSIDLPAPPSVEEEIRKIGGRLLRAMEIAERPLPFSRKHLHSTLLKWAMQDTQFKTQLFRFIDVLPALKSQKEVARHLKEYLDAEDVELAPALRLAVRAGGLAGGLLSGGVRSQVTALARQFMLGRNEREVVRTLRHLNERGIAFSVDVLGETVVSEAEADRYAQTYLELLESLARETARWPVNRSNVTPRGEIPRLNLSVKISALFSQIHPADPDTAIDRIADRLRPLLRRAKHLGAFVNFDMESYALKDLTLRLFQTVFDEPEFRAGPACGLALQAYLRDTESDLREIVAWARERQRRITIRLVKGAYWEYETILARQRSWPEPVFTRKAETDLSFEELSVYLLENAEVVDAAFGTHNVRSIAHALAQADRLGVPRASLEFQGLHGMAEALGSALRKFDLRVREYCPVGELLPGMAYLVRRLLENTSNEGFIANQLAKHVAPDELLASPAELLRSPERTAAGHDSRAGGQAGLDATAGASARAPAAAPRQDSDFRNEPPADFTRSEERDKILLALRQLRPQLGRKHPLVINNQPVPTRDWTSSLNPADQDELIGLAARAGIAEAELALAAARAAQPDWARHPAEDRAAWLDRTADLLQRDRAILTALEILEAGKTWIEADADLVEAIDFCRFYAATIRVLGRPQRTQFVPGESNVQHWWPRGVAVVIAPWNFPLAILTGMTVAAAVAGNTVVLKPSDQTPVIAARLVEVMIEAGLPPGVVNLVTGPGSEIGAHLVAYPQVDLIAFTGSREVGLRIWETAGRTHPGQVNLKKVICEMGGKNALIIDGDADLDEAVTGALASAFDYQGQKCSALSRLIVLNDCYDAFLERLIGATASLPAGPAEQPGSRVGPVIDRAAQQRILKMIEVGRQEATLAWQGRVPDDPKACYVPPTLFTGVRPHCRIFREEIFGPVLSVSRANDFEEALALANDCAFALTGGLYSRSPAHIERARNELICGNLYINRRITGAIVGRQPFGGFKMSGAGTKAGGREYLEHFLVPRVVTENCLRRGFAPLEE